MKTWLLLLQGGGKGAYEADRKLAENLRMQLGEEVEVVYPQMPDEDRPDYQAWRDRVAEILMSRGGRAIWAGHSLGASFLLKYLSEEEPPTPPAGVFLIAPPYWGAEGWEVEEYRLCEGSERKLTGYRPIVFYHSRDDKIVPCSHLALYAEKLPHAHTREFMDRGHQFAGNLREVADDIRLLVLEEQRGGARPF
ncbi:alpha/beta hydrolase [Paenibacillus sp. CC-CFT747]|nr:alpha/beta hydrolase [Paenibacillus sp. CC-CFT747]